MNQNRRGTTHIHDLRGRPVELPSTEDYRRAKRIREVFQDQPVSYGAYPAIRSWPKVFHQLGEGRSVAYTSNKWKKLPSDWEDYKHVAEGPQIVFGTDALVHANAKLRRPQGGDRAWPKFEPAVEMPDVVAELAPCLFLEFRPFVSVSGGRVVLADYALQVETPGAILFAGKARPAGSGPNWRGRGSPFLAIGLNSVCLALVVGPRLDVLKDGIVGLVEKKREERAPWRRTREERCPFHRRMRRRTRWTGPSACASRERRRGRCWRGRGEGIARPTCRTWPLRRCCFCSNGWRKQGGDHRKRRSRSAR